MTAHGADTYKMTIATDSKSATVTGRRDGPVDARFTFISAEIGTQIFVDLLNYELDFYIRCIMYINNTCLC